MTPATVKRRAEDGQLLLPPAHAHAHDEPALRERVDRREHLRHHHRVAVPQDEDGGAEPRALGGDRRRGQHGDGLEVRRVRLEGEAATGIPAAGCPGKDHVVADPQGRHLPLLGLARERDHRVARGQRSLVRQMAPDLHA